MKIINKKRKNKVKEEQGTDWKDKDLKKKTTTWNTKWM